MRKVVDYELVDQLLDDESLSLNQVADLAGCSSWSVRQFWRKRTGDTRPMKAGVRPPPWRDEAAANDEPLGALGWLIVGGFAVAIVAACIIGMRRNPGDWPPFPGSEPMP